jgi:hypothetical protein
MDKLTREEWENILEQLAVDAGADWLKDMHSKKWYEANEEGQKAMHDAVLKRLMGEYPYEKVTNRDMKALQDMKALDWAKFVNGIGPDPRAMAEKAKFDKYLPLLTGNAEEGKDWMSMSAPALKYLAADQYGMDYTKEGFGEFLDNLSKYQKMYDRGEILKDMRGRGWYLPMKIAFPKMMEATENAIAEGKHPKNLGLLYALDMGVNGAQMMLPGLNVVKANPVLTGAIDAGLQGVAEAGRQLGGDIIGDVEADYSEAPLATSFGLTRPGMMGTAQGMLGQLTGPNARQFARGFARSTRAGNPVVGERAILEKNIDRFNSGVKLREAVKKLEEDLAKRNGIPIKSMEDPIVFASLPQKQAYMSSNTASTLKKVLGLPPEEAGIDKAAALNAYDKLNPSVWIKQNPDGTYSTLKFADLELQGNKVVAPPRKTVRKDGRIDLDSETEEILRSLIPAKIAEIEERTPAAAWGMKAGRFLGDLGGSFEPTFKVNPFDITEPRADAYKDTQWYRNLSKESKAIVDEAFKKKQDEED